MLGNTLTVDDLMIRKIIIVDLCCICNRNGENVDHLLLHCSVAVKWVMPPSVFALLKCWQRNPGSYRNKV